MPVLLFLLSQHIICYHINVTMLMFIFHQHHNSFFKIQNETVSKIVIGSVFYSTDCDWQIWFSMSSVPRNPPRGFWLRGLWKPTFSPLMPDMSKVHTLAQQATKATLCRAGNFHEREQNSRWTCLKGKNTRTGLHKQAKCFDVKPEAIN